MWLSFLSITTRRDVASYVSFRQMHVLEKDEGLGKVNNLKVWHVSAQCQLLNANCDFKPAVSQTPAPESPQ